MTRMSVKVESQDDDINDKEYRSNYNTEDKEINPIEARIVQGTLEMLNSQRIALDQT